METLFHAQALEAGRFLQCGLAGAPWIAHLRAMNATRRQRDCRTRSGILAGLLSACFIAASPSLLTAQGFDPMSQDDSLALVRHFTAPEEALGPPLDSGGFLPLPGETVSLMGGELVYRMEGCGHFEALLHASFPGLGLRVRYPAWPSDTVGWQQRPMYFHTEEGDPREGSVPDLRERLEPGLFLLFFGRMESLEGLEGLDEFEMAYDRLVSALAGLSRRLVLVGPMPFSEAGPAAELAKERNETLAAYAARCAEVAERHGALYVESPAMEPADFLRNGIYLSPEGQARYAARLAETLGLAAAQDGVPVVGVSDEVLAAIRWKNRLWHQYHRPTNWAFLFGDRQHQPSSRDHEDASRRWFVEEVERLTPLIASADEAIWRATASSSAGSADGGENGGASKGKGGQP